MARRASRQSRLEDWAEAILLDEGYSYEREYVFAPPRRFRADFRVWRPMRLKQCLVEIEGVTRFGKSLGRHQTADGFANDCEKYNLAALRGFVVFRFTETMLREGQLEATLAEYFGTTGDTP